MGPHLNPLSLSLFRERVIHRVDLRDYTAAVWPKKYTAAESRRGKFGELTRQNREGSVFSCVKQKKCPVKELFDSYESCPKTFHY